MHTGLYELTNYFHERLPERRANSGEDIISFLLQLIYDNGESLKENHVLGSLHLILVAAIDTTWSAIGAQRH